jgi:hypothetical protein
MWRVSFPGTPGQTINMYLFSDCCEVKNVDDFGDG